MTESLAHDDLKVSDSTQAQTVQAKPTSTSTTQIVLYKKQTTHGISLNPDNLRETADSQLTPDNHNIAHNTYYVKSWIVQ